MRLRKVRHLAVLTSLPLPEVLHGSGGSQVSGGGNIHKGFDDDTPYTLMEGHKDQLLKDVPEEFPLAPIASFDVGYGLVIVVIHNGHLTD